MDDGTSTLITVIIPLAYLTYHTHPTDSLFGGNNYTVRYHELAGSEMDHCSDDVPVARAATKTKSNMLPRKGRSGSICLRRYSKMIHLCLP